MWLSNSFMKDKICERVVYNRNKWTPTQSLRKVKVYLLGGQVFSYF